ncbi:MAG TPA: hypothetical protein VHM02_14415, partial [Thermoanaerobaculia bacterium]|nr:hypothetical protein [Thermoanaerobaculia bacterium]
MRALVRTLAAVTAVLAGGLLLAPPLAPPAEAAEGWSAVGLQVREGRRPAAGVEVRLRAEGPSLADPGTVATGVTDDEGRAVIYVAPGVWRLELLRGGEVAYFVSLRVTPGRRAEELGSPARDVDAPDLRWRYFAVDEPPPVELLEPRRTAPRVTAE